MSTTVQRQGPSTKLIKPKTKAGKRALEKRAPKTVEDPRRALILYGNNTSQIIKDVLVDVQKMKYPHSLKFSRKNDDVRPFEAGGDATLETHAQRANCSLFALGNHSKKRPQNLTLGRFYDFRMYDCVEFGVTSFKPIREFPAATNAQQGNKPAFIFVGEAFESHGQLKQVKSLLLDFFRGRQIESINLKGIDRVIFVTHAPLDEAEDASGQTPSRPPVVYFRQYSIKYKRSGTRIPRVQLTEMGPKMDLEVRRHRAAPVDLEKEVCKQPKTTGKKQKNVSGDMLAGKVGRIYMPKQDVDGIALRKMKGLKRERREAASNKESKKSKQQANDGEK